MYLRRPNQAAACETACCSGHARGPCRAGRQVCSLRGPRRMLCGGHDLYNAPSMIFVSSPRPQRSSCDIQARPVELQARRVAGTLHLVIIMRSTFVQALSSAGRPGRPVARNNCHTLGSCSRIHCNRPNLYLLVASLPTRALWRPLSAEARVGLHMGLAQTCASRTPSEGSPNLCWSRAGTRLLRSGYTCCGVRAQRCQRWTARPAALRTLQATNVKHVAL